MNQITYSQKILAALLSLAMILTMVSAFTVVSVNAATASYNYTRNLTVGSRGADVTALQAMLNAGGFLSVSPTGYFGSLTKAALAAWQASVGISPASGYFGPITRGYVASNGAGTPTTVPPVTGGTPGCPAGAAYNYMTGQACSTTTPGTPAGLDNSDGSATVSLSSYAADTSVKKGETKDMVAVKVQATAGKVAVTRFDVRMNNRPWLYFSKITLKDSDGNVIATKNLSSSGDSTEITVGSDYLVRFEGINYVVTPGTDKTLVVSGTGLVSTDKLSSDVAIIVSVPNSSIRVINGKGYTDSLGLGTVAVSGTTGRTITLTGSGSNGNVISRINPSTPLQRIQTTSTSGQTNDVTLGVFDYKAENQNATLNTLKFILSTNGANQPAWSTVFKNLRIVVDGGSTYNVDSVASTSTFSNLNIPLTTDAWKSITLKADVSDQDEFLSGTVLIASTTVNTTNIVGVDANYNTLTASGGNVPTANQITFLAAGVAITNQSATYTLSGGTNGSKSANVNFKFTLVNNGNTDVYISKVPALALATSTTGSVGSPASASSTLTYVTADPSEGIGGDAGTAPTTGQFIIPANGSRSFSYSGTVDNTNGTAGLRVFKITQINFATTTNVASSSINFGLSNLVVTPSLVAS
jgi:hypothetical protein